MENFTSSNFASTGPAEIFGPTLLSPSTPLCSVSIEKRDNGYSVQLIAVPKAAPAPDPEYKIEEPPLEEKIDSMMDGLSAFLRHINDRSAGESWKEDEGKESLRKAFTMLFPGIVNRMKSPPKVTMPRVESCVFETKEGMLAYLTKNL